MVQSKNTLPDLIKDVAEFLRHLGKVAVVLKINCRGFVANRLQAVVLREACFLFESGVVDVDEIDAIMTEGID